ncbi:hypothetical protein [Brucella ovis]|uniref:hypothetical protein n=1 Tax=Brucella ovis TaxID=236 RepID=UPI001558E64E|nr:hypothetical protein [Brucella ovis]
MKPLWPVRSIPTDQNKTHRKPMGFVRALCLFRGAQLKGEAVFASINALKQKIGEIPMLLAERDGFGREPHQTR